MNSFCAWYSFRMSFWRVPPRRARSRPLLGRGDDGEEGGSRPVDGHRGRDLAEVDPVEEVLHVGERVDRHAALADLAECERSSESRPISVGRSNAVDSPSDPWSSRSRKRRWCRRCRSGEHAHGPQLRAVHGGVRLAVRPPAGNCRRQARRRAPAGPRRWSRTRRLRCEAESNCFRHCPACSSVPVSQGRVTSTLMAEKQAPDWNLAMEMVRVTEAAALAASSRMGRGQGRGRRGSSRRHARRPRPCRWTGSSSSVKARRTKRPCCSTARRSATARRRTHRRRSHRRDHAHLTGGATRWRSSPCPSALFNPGPRVYMEKIAVGPEAAGRTTSTPPSPRT